MNRTPEGTKRQRARAKAWQEANPEETRRHKREHAARRLAAAVRARAKWLAEAEKEASP